MKAVAVLVFVLAIAVVNGKRRGPNLPELGRMAVPIRADEGEGRIEAPFEIPSHTDGGGHHGKNLEGRLNALLMDQGRGGGHHGKSLEGRLNALLMDQGRALPKAGCMPKCFALGLNPMAMGKCIKDCITGKEPEEEEEESEEDDE